MKGTIAGLSIFMTIGLALCLGLSGRCYAEKVLVAKRVDQAPVIDGSASDACWDSAGSIMTHDEVAQIDVALKSVYTGKEIFFLVRFPDQDESRTHRWWVWNQQRQVYEGGPDREDVFVLKWFMENRPEDISLHADTGHFADIWFWKANRTDPLGYADDKTQKLSLIELEKSRPIISRSGKTMYLQRRGDEGTPAYTQTLYVDYVKDRMSRFESQTPSGSRADIRAKGQWAENTWTIEFSRALKTGHSDDVQLDVSRKYLFGISRYEMAGREPEKESTQPLYGSGDLSEKLILVFDE